MANPTPPTSKKQEDGGAIGGGGATGDPNNESYYNNNDNIKMAEWRELMDQIAVTLDSKEYVQRFWREGTRPDGRLFSQTRPTTLQLGPLSLRHASNANSMIGGGSSSGGVVGSSMVALGETRVLGGVTLAVGQPATAEQGSGGGGGGGSSSLSCCGDVVVTLSPPCGIEESSLQQQWAPIQAYVQRILDETLSLEQLSLQSILPSSTTTTATTTSSSSQQQTARIGLLALRLQVTIQVLNHDGNLWDAALLASVAALQNTILPDSDGVMMDANNGQIWFRENHGGAGRPFQLPILPIPLTLGLWVGNPRHATTNDENLPLQDQWITDPTLLEEESGHLNSALTIVMDAAAARSAKVSAASDNNNNNDSSSPSSVEDSWNPTILSLEYTGTATIDVETDLLLSLHMAAARAKEMGQLLLRQD
ncbi:hypothetical protein ACA910_004291 [Epithemia clementina (nom. ined.)]